ncbi:MAG: hypothetical protein JW891_15960 [Candidatus Lokiarchaeota archaeon]|nr:hypothetical protein [Candidatus Lokiarchaeota archaeon]
MGEEIQKFTKLTLLIHLIIGCIMTLLFFIPEITFGLLSIAYNGTVGAIAMALASAMLGLTISSLCGLMAKEWMKIKIVVINELVWLLGLLITTIINLATFGAIGIVMIVVNIILLLLFLLSFLQQEDKMKELLK